MVFIGEVVPALTMIEELKTKITNLIAEKLILEFII